MAKIEIKRLVKEEMMRIVSCCFIMLNIMFENCDYAIYKVQQEQKISYKASVIDKLYS